MNTDSGVRNGPSLMAAAAAQASRVVGGVTGHAMDAATPCAEWDLRALVNHTILWTAYSAERRAHGQSVEADLMSRDFTADPGFAEDYAAQIGKAVDAWSDPAAWERELGVMGSTTPAADVAAMLIMEMVLHGWDIASATGQRYACPDDVAALVLATVEAQGELFRQYQGFAAVVAPPAGGQEPAVLHRALRLSGRDPGWQRPGR
jgi:uncharacterized protein (TIGR03086 family)